MDAHNTLTEDSYSYPQLHNRTVAELRVIRCEILHYLIMHPWSNPVDILEGTGRLSSYNDSDILNVMALLSAMCKMDRVTAVSVPVRDIDTDMVLYAIQGETSTPPTELSFAFMARQA